MFHKVLNLLDKAKSDTKLEWLVVVSVLVLLALATGWIDLDWPRPF